MDLKDMILVMENYKGTERNMLMTLEDYKKFVAIDDMSELADRIFASWKNACGRFYRVLQGSKCYSFCKIL